MPSFPNPTKNSILVANFQNVAISCVRTKGKQRCYPGYVKFYTALGREGKGWLIARNNMKNALLFNTMIPGEVPVEVMRETLMLHIGKIPSLSYLNKQGKPILTFWDFQFDNFPDLKKFCNLVLAFSKLADAVNVINDIATPLATFQGHHLKTIPDELGLLSSCDDDSIDLLDKSTSDKSANDENNSLYNLSDPDSPVFAKSQDVYESLSLKKYDKKNFNTPSRKFNELITVNSPLVSQFISILKNRNVTKDSRFLAC